ncbi:hypothetical protein V8J88_01685 [Massilia sp. W12]|uniref:hypothetical protein n=1 Tax=Massilia sp. W12 TaxID=3126507 RepID=UPI0030CF9166
MKKTLHILPALLASMGMLCTASAQAATHSLNSEVQYSLQLIDLDLHDGVTPAFLYQDVLNTLTTRLDTKKDGVPNTDLYNSPWISNQSFSAELRSHDSRNHAAIGAQNKQNHGIALQDAGRAINWSGARMQLALTPNTRLQVVIHENAQAQLAAGDDLAQAGFYLKNSFSYYGWNTGQNDFVETVLGQTGGAFQHSKEYTFNIDNLSGGSAGYYLYFSSDVRLGNLPTAPVPEAETWAMLGGGLLMLGALARRRKRD